MRTIRWAWGASMLIAFYWACGEGDTSSPQIPVSVQEPDGGGNPPPGETSPDGGSPDAGPLKTSPWKDGIIGAAQGILETPVVGTSTDEAQNLWMATPVALYLLRPGDTRAHRFDARDGLHLATNPVHYCDSAFVHLNSDGTPNEPDWQAQGLETGTPICPIDGAANGGGIAEIVGGAAGEVFVGYHGNDEGSATKYDPQRHSGKLDRVRLSNDGTQLTVDRMDMVSSNNTFYWHNRTIERLLYDHIVHPHELYVGTNHGVDLILPDRFRTPHPGEWFNTVNLEWMSDHLHPRVCFHAPCVPTPSAGEANQRIGDWRGIAIAPSGDVWVAGKWTAGAIRPVEDQFRLSADPTAFMNRWSSRPGDQAFSKAFGDPYFYAGGSNFINEPVFRVPAEGDPVHLTAVTVAPDGRVWFASGPPNATQGPSYGIAVWDGHRFQTYSPRVALGVSEQEVQDMVALPDGRLAVAFRNSGLVLWNPTTGTHTPFPGLANPRILRLELDSMVTPPALHISTGQGAQVWNVTAP